MNIQITGITIAALLAFALAPVVHSKDYGNGRENLAPSLLLENSNGQNDHWKGIGRLIINASHPDSHCTATLIDTRDHDTGTSGPAYVLTSAHCVSFDSLNVVAHQASDGHIDFNYFHDTANDHRRYALKRVTWSRLRGLDMAIVELDASLQTLMDNGIQPLQLKTSTPAIAAELLIVGAPTQYPERGLRLSTCRHVSIETLIEQPAIHRGFYKDNCQGLRPGSSGSPLLDRYSNEVLGVVSTSTATSLPENRCMEDAPCELKNGWPHWSAGTNYASPTAHLQHCFAQGLFRASTAGCDLMPSVTFSQKRPMVNYYQRVKYDADGSATLPTWQFAFSLDQPLYRYKSVRDPQLCESPNHYSDVMSAEDAQINDPVGAEPGIYLLCIVGVDSAEQSPTVAMMKSPLVIATEIAEPGPTRAPQFDITRQNNGDHSIQWHFSNPTLSAYEYKAGAESETNCDEPEGYAITFDDALIAASGQPVKLCTKAFDMSGQRSAPRMDLLGA